jgi:large subunit ribosomal protein L10
MLRTEKQATIDSLKERFDRMTSAVFIDFQGMTVADVSELRDEFRKAAVEYKVVKNTLARRALGEGGTKELEGVLVGMTGIAWSFEEPSAAAKVVKAFQKKNEKLKVKGGLIDGKVIDGNAVVNTLATMPGKDELRSQLLATLQAPLQQFLALLNAPAQNFAYLLKAREDQQEKGG